MEEMMSKCLVCEEEKPILAKGKCLSCYQREYKRRPEVKARQREYARKRLLIEKNRNDILQENPDLLEKLRAEIMKEK